MRSPSSQLRNAPALHTLSTWNPCCGKEDTSDFVAYVAGLGHAPRGDQLDLCGFPVISSSVTPHARLRNLIVSPRGFSDIPDTFGGKALLENETAAGERFMGTGAFGAKLMGFLKRMPKPATEEEDPRMEWLILETSSDEMVKALEPLTRKLKVCKAGLMLTRLPLASGSGSDSGAAAV